jgi:peptidoglycan/LPS O-acetylase OafA/YrhL
MATQLSYQPSIDGLRALAVLAVVLYHADVLGMRAGYMGVDIFFVISGFLISRIIIAEFAADRFTLVGFYERRVRRIIPALLVMVATTLAVGWYVLMPLDYKRLAQSAAATGLFASNIFFWRQQQGGYFDPASTEQPLLHTWSLGIEEQFYILFPLLIWFVLRYLAPHRLFITISILCFASLVLASVGAFVKPVATFYLLPTRAWELFAGSLLSIAKLPPLRFRSVQNALSLIAIALLIGPIWLYPRSMAFPGLAALPPVLGAVLIIWLGPSGPASRVLSLTPMRFVGRVSYSFYLWHFPFLAFVAYTSVQHDRHSIQIIALLFAFLAAIISTFLLEEPLRRNRSQRIAARVVARGTLASLLMTGIAVSLSTPAVLREIYGAQADAAFVHAAFIAEIERGNTCMSWDGTRLDDVRCLIGKRGQEPRFALWGDSHAMMFQHVFDESAKDFGTAGVLIGAFACPPYASSNAPNSKCSSINERLIAELANKNAIRTVILVSHWSRYFEGFRLRDSRMESSNPLLTNSPHQNVVALNSTIRGLADRGRSVVLIGPAPEIMIDGDRLHYLRARGFLIDDVAQAPPEALHRMKLTSELLIQAVSGTNARIVWPSDLLCLEDVCPLERGGTSILSDDNHLSDDGARVLRPLADEIMRTVTRVSSFGMTYQHK